MSASSTTTPSNTHIPSATPIPCIIFAGGKSQRLQIDQQPKWNLPFAGNKTLLQHTIDRLFEPSSERSIVQDTLLFISAPYKTAKNQPTIDKLAKFKYPLIHDTLADFQGPLAALMSCLAWAKTHDYPWVATVACDTPFFPNTILTQLWDNKPASALACVPRCQGRIHPVFGIWSSSLYDELEQWVIGEQRRGLVPWANAKAHHLDFSADKNKKGFDDPFFNINTPEDYQLALQYKAE